MIGPHAHAAGPGLFLLFILGVVVIGFLFSYWEDRHDRE